MYVCSDHGRIEEPHFTKVERATYNSPAEGGEALCPVRKCGTSLTEFNGYLAVGFRTIQIPR